MKVFKRTASFLWGASWWVGLALSPENYAALMADCQKVGR